MKKLLLSRKSIEKIFIAALLLAIPLYPKFPLIEIPNTSVRIRLEDFLLFFMGLWVAGNYIFRIKNLIKNHFERTIVIFLLGGLLSCISGIFLTKTVIPSITFLHWARRLEYLIPLFFALNLERKNIKEYVDFSIKLILLTIVLLTIYGIGQKYFSFPVIATQNTEYSKGIALRYVTGAHLTATFAGHYDLASYLVLTLPVVAAFLAGLKNRKARIVVMAIFIMGLWLLSNTLSRISVVAYLGAVVLSLFALKKIRAVIVIVLISILVFSLSTNLLDRYLSILRVAKESINKIMIINVPEAYALGPALPGGPHFSPSVLAAFEDRSTSIRLNVEWPRAIRAFEKNPLLGTGYSSITLATDNDYLRLIGEVGIVGFLGFFLIIARITDYLIISIKSKTLIGTERAYAIGMFGAFAGALLSATFIDIFEASKYALIFWFMIGLMVVIIRNNEKTIK